MQTKKATKEQFYSQLNKFIAENNPTLSFDGEDRVSSILLFKDFIRRLSLWKTELRTPFTMYGKKDIFDLFKDLKANWLDELVPFKEYEQYMIENYTYSSSNLNYMFAYLFINWEIFRDYQEIRKYSYLESPYESVIRIFASKNNTYKRDLVNVSGVSIIYGKKNFKLPSLDTDFLDFIDSKCKLQGSTGIPNQEETNRLWEDFQNNTKLT